MTLRLMLLICSATVLQAQEAAAPTSATGAPVAAEQAQQELEQFVVLLSQSPTIRAMRLRFAAAQRAETAAGRLPDPMVGFGYARMRMPMENRPIYEVMLEQPLPRWGERDASRALAYADSAMAAADMQRDVGLLAGQIASWIADMAGIQERITESQEELKRIRALSDTIAARVGQGGATVLDSLAITSRIASLQVRIADWERQVADKSADIRAWLGIPATQVLPQFSAPMPTTVDQTQTPAIRQALAERDNAIAHLRAAQSMRRPMTAIGIRGMLEETDGGNERTIGATVSVSLPFATGAISAEIEAALTRVHAADRFIEAARLQAHSAFGIATRAVLQAQQTTELAQTLITQAAAEQQTLITAAAGAGTSITAILDVSDRLADLRITLIDATVSANQARAALWQHVIIKLPSATGHQP